MALTGLAAQDLTLGYDGKVVVENLSLSIAEQCVSVIVGPNGCGKSTLLRALARVLRPVSGAVILDGKDVHSQNGRALAKRIGMLPQAPAAPESITVAELVSRGLYPHQHLFRQWSPQDEAALAQALADTEITHLATREVDSLSGGQRQRVWVAMALAQDPRILLLDEPTTYLDVAHQLDVLELLGKLNRTRRTTIVMVLHDLNLAARFGDHIVMMRDGEIIEQGTPAEVITTESVRETFDLEAAVIPDPVMHTPMVVPIGRARRQAP